MQEDKKPKKSKKQQDKKNRQPKWLKIYLPIMLCLVILYFIASSERITMPQYDITQQQAPQLQITKPQKIALITDLHSCFYGENQHEIMDVLTKQQPDMILLVGDIYDDVLPNDNADILLKQFQNLKAKHQVYYVNGNHELWMKPADYANVEKKIRSYGIHILHGQGASIANSNIKVWGVADQSSGQLETQLQTVGGLANKQDFNILLSHRPEYIEQYKNYPFDLVVSGHAHGGQWRIPYLLNGFYAPNQGLLPKYAGGEYRFDNNGRQLRFIVSRGLARESTRYIPRIFNRPELVMIQLS
ncbi:MULTISPECIES: metallophosphoesterase [unclassified Acinetobacter]|uniref:metallophosphoesterase n=1 Tax=unclassified Acinetobacter TaxID=196816 RepID=UPI0035B71081